MRPVRSIAFALLLAASCSLQALAAEPDAPSGLMGPGEAVRAAIQERLSAKFTSTSEWRTTAQGALVEYYSAPENKLLWVDANGGYEPAVALRVARFRAWRPRFHLGSHFAVSLR